VIHRLHHTAAAILVAVVVCFVAATVVAEPYEDNPEASARDADYAAGKAALTRKDWAEALKRFRQAWLRDPDNADLHNYLGFSYRNLKQMDLAFKHYKRSIELNPRHRGAHEYIGEAYLMVNDLANAEMHLAALRKICLLPCEELTDLEKAVAGYRARAGKGAPGTGSSR
jgi:tetratricopeptide (TPR) repeat protein